MNLSAEFNFGIGFAPYNGPYMGLVDAYDPVVYRVLPGIEHLFLLLIKRMNDHQVSLLTGIQREQGTFIQQPINAFEVPGKVTKLFTYAPAYLLAGLALLLGDLQKLLSCLF